MGAGEAPIAAGRSAVRRAAGRLASAVTWLRDVVWAHPRHLVLAGVVAGLLTGPVSRPAAVAAAVAALALAGRAVVGLVAALAVLGGAALADARIAARDAGVLAGLAGRPVASEAVVTEPVRDRGFGMRAARVLLRSGPGAGEQAVARIAPEAGWPRAAGVGDIVAVRGRVAPLDDFEAYQRRRGAQAALVVERARATGRRRTGLLGALDGARRRVERALAAGVPVREAALLRGMVLGEDEDLEETAREEFRRSGLAHLLAASGQNVMLLAILAIAAATALGAGLRLRLTAALVLVAVYVPLAGAGPSIQRAGIMGAAGLVAALAGRPASRWYALGLAAAVTLAIEPRVAAEPGWQLSFAAVVALLALAPPLREALARHGCPGALADALAVTVAATLGTAPLMALHFEAVSLASLPANVLAAPAVAPVMWLGTLAGAVGQVSTAAAAPLSTLAGYPVAYVEWVAHVTAQLPAASVGVGLPGPLGTLAAYAGIGGGVAAARSQALRRAARRLAPRGRAERRAAIAALVVGGGLAAVFVARTGGPVPRAPGELVVSFLDVGQGDATLLQLDGTSVLFDTGPPAGPILRRLREAGVGRLDALVITHAQADHEGMAPAVLGAHPARMVLNGGAGGSTPVQRRLPALAARAGARTVVPHAGQVLRAGGLRISVLWPPPRAAGAPAPEGDPNDRAVVAHVRVGEFDLLLPADAESSVTAALPLPEVEALKLAHHGSEDAGLAAELARLRPRFAAVEVGADNVYGHPAASTLAALRAVPEVARTDRHGTIRLRVAGGRMRIERERG